MLILKKKHCFTNKILNDVFEFLCSLNKYILFINELFLSVYIERHTNDILYRDRETQR